jgi:hypothetical protein
MIKYSLICENEHEFEGWFPNSEEFDNQNMSGMISCPTCETTLVGKAVMAPGVQTSRRKEAKAETYRRDLAADTMMMASQAKSVMRKIRKMVESEFEDVGDRFYDEAVKASEGERDDKIYGTPTKEEVNDLLEDGIDLFHVPEIKDN